jgi:hypothetical protein
MVSRLSHSAALMHTRAAPPQLRALAAPVGVSTLLPRLASTPHWSEAWLMSPSATARPSWGPSDCGVSDWDTGGVCFLWSMFRTAAATAAPPAPAPAAVREDRAGLLVRAVTSTPSSSLPTLRYTCTPHQHRDVKYLCGLCILNGVCMVSMSNVKRIITVISMDRSQCQQQVPCMAATGWLQQQGASCSSGSCCWAGH